MILKLKVVTPWLLCSFPAMKSTPWNRVLVCGPKADAVPGMSPGLYLAVCASACANLPSRSLPNDFWVSEHKKRDKQDRHCLKIPRVELVELQCSTKMAHPTVL